MKKLSGKAGRGMRWMLLPLLLSTLPAWGADIRQLAVTHEAGLYTVSLEMEIAAPRSAIFRVLSDYGHWTRLNSKIFQSRIVSASTDGHYRVYSQTRACVLFYCMDIAQLQDITQQDEREIVAVTLPVKGRLRQGWVRWLLNDDDGRTRVMLNVRLTPDFWVPPLLGPWAIRSFLRQQTQELADKLETLATSAASP